MKKKLLFINGHLDTGGVEKALLDVLRHLDYDRYDVDLLLTEHMGDYSPLIPSEVNVILRSLEGTYGSYLSVVKNCIRRGDWFSLKMRTVFLLMRFFGIKCIALAKKMLTKNRKYDCVIGFRSGICTQIAAYAVNAKRRITWWHHGCLNVEINTYLDQTRKIDHIVAVSENCRHMLTEAMPSIAARTVAIYNMLDAAYVCDRAEEFKPPYSPDLLHIVSVGRLAREKHFENAIVAAKMMKDQGISFCWHLIGDGELRAELEGLANRHNVRDCFAFEGNQINPYPYIKHADLFVHPSYVESFGIVVAEALALGIPCVVTKSMGVMDFLKDGENAVLTEQSAEDLSEKVMSVLGKPELLKALKNNAHCPEQFLPETVIQKINELLDDVLLT